LRQQAITMSGDEQQMLMIVRVVAADPEMILLDEPSKGVVPMLVDEMFELLLKLIKAGKIILLVERNVETALAAADRAYIID
jgi:branched-chain amino acid transport system ATP-binding protein